MELLNERPPSSAELLGSSQLAIAIGCSSNSQLSASTAAAAAAAAATTLTTNHLGLTNNKSSNVGAGVSFSSTIAGCTSSPPFSCSSSSFSSPSSFSSTSNNSTSFSTGTCLPASNSILSSTSALVSSSLVANHSASPVTSFVATHHLDHLINSTGGLSQSPSLSSLPGVCNSKNQSHLFSSSASHFSSSTNPLSTLSTPFISSINHHTNLSHPSSIVADQLSTSSFNSGRHSSLINPSHHAANSLSLTNKSIRSVLGPVLNSSSADIVVPTSGLNPFSLNSQVLPHPVISQSTTTTSSSLITPPPPPLAHPHHPSSSSLSINQTIHNNPPAHLHHHHSHHLHHSVTSPLSASSVVKVKRTRQRVDAGEPRNSYASITNYSCSRLAKQQREAHFAAQLSASLHQAVQQQNSFQLQQFQQQFNSSNSCNNNLIANRLPPNLTSSHQTFNQNPSAASLSPQQEQHQKHQQQLSLLNQLAQLQSNPAVAKQLLEQLNSYGALGLQTLFSALASSSSGPDLCCLGSDTSFDSNQTSPVLDSAQTATFNALLASLSTVKPSMILLDEWNSCSSNCPPPPPLSSSASGLANSMAAMQADSQMLDLNTLNNSEQAVSLDYSNKGRRFSKLESEMDSAQPVSPATPTNLMKSSKLTTTNQTANQPRCADSESGSTPNSPTATVSPANDENDPNTHNNSKDDPNQDDQTQPMDQLQHKNQEERTTAAITSTINSTAAIVNSVSPAVSRCSSPQSVASSSASTKSAESKRARVDSIVNSMLTMAERGPSSAFDRADGLTTVQSVNGCKKRKLNQPQQCRTESIEPGLDLGMANSDLEQLTCEPELDSNADEDDDDMDQNSIDDGDENSFSDRHMGNRNGFSMNSKNDFDRVRSHVEHLVQLYVQQQQEVNRLNGQPNSNNNNCVAINLTTSASPPLVQTTDLNDDCESTDSRSELPEQVQAALNECSQLLHETQRLLSSKRIYSDLRHKLRSKLRAAAHWGESLQAQPIFDELRQQIQSACSQAVEQCFTKQRLTQMQAAIAVRITPPSVRSKDNNALICGSKTPLQSSLANLLDPRNSMDVFAELKAMNQFNQLKNGVLNNSSLPVTDTLPASLLHQFNILQQQQQRLSSPLTAGGQVRRESASGDSLSGLPLMTPKRRRIKASDEPRRTRTSNRLPPPCSNNTPVAAVASAMKSTSEMLASIMNRELNSPAGAGSVSSVSQPSVAAAAAAAANQLQMSNPMMPVSLASQNDILNGTNIFGNPFGSQLLNGSSNNNAELDLHHLLNVANGASSALLNNPLLANGLGAVLGNGSARGSPDSMQNFAHLGLLGRLPEGLGDGGSDVSMGDLNFDNLPITATLSPMHLRKAKLMFFYVRYPHSNVLKVYFPDISFNKANTAQLVKWFSNFREFYYIQIEKYTRAAIADGIVNADEIVVPMDSEIIRVLNLHYNRNNHIELPETFRDVVEKTMREFYKAIKDGRDDEAGWKKIIYKIIQRYEDQLPDYFKKPNFLEVLDGSMRE